MGSHPKLHPKWCSSPTDLSTKGQCDLSFSSLQCSKSTINFNKPLGFDLNMLSLGEWICLSKSYFHWLIWKSIFTANQWYAAEKAMAPHSSTLAWKIPWMEEPGGLQSMGLLQSDTTERLHFHFSLSCIGEGNGNPLQCSCLENPRDGGAWLAAVYGVTQSRRRLTRLSSSSSNGMLKWLKGCWGVRIDIP